MLPLCHNLTLGIYARYKSLFVDLDETGRRIVGLVGPYYDRLVASKTQR